MRTSSVNNFCISCKSCTGLPYSGKYWWGPNFVLFVLSLSEQKLNTQTIHYDGVFSCVMDRTKIKHTNQLEIAQNEIWTPRNFPLYGSSLVRQSRSQVQATSARIASSITCVILEVICAWRLVWKRDYWLEILWVYPSIGFDLRVRAIEYDMY